MSQKSTVSWRRSASGAEGAAGGGAVWGSAASGVAGGEAGFQGIVVQGELHFERPIRHTAPLAQERNDMIYHRDKVHPVPSLPYALPVYTGATPS